ncbi:MAG: hypothetical protein H8E15_03365 [Planctomycetes bacterium]|nr:hypothetical protein [Planctomycetota bacterium]
MLGILLPVILPLLPIAVDQPISAHLDVAPAPLVNAAVDEPEIWIAFPTEGQALTPVVLVGLDFANEGYAPRFGITPSIPLFQFGIDLPFLGQASLMVTTAPPAIFSGEVDLYLKKGLFGRESNRLTFTYL